MDIYSLGLIFLELFVPLSSRSELCDTVERLKRPNFHEMEKLCKLKRETRKLLHLMISTNAEERPSAKMIFDYFTTGKNGFEEELVHFEVNEDDDDA